MQIALLLNCDVLYMKYTVVHQRCLVDYVGFIKKVMKQMQLPQYTNMKRIDVDLRPLEELEGQAPNTGW